MRRLTCPGNLDSHARYAVCRTDRGAASTSQYHALSVTVALSGTSQLASASRSTC
jgi:hypothetical protein